jgi:beta-lactamase class D
MFRRRWFGPLAGLAALIAACAHRTEPSAVSRPVAHGARPSSCFLLHEIGVGDVRRLPADGCDARVSPVSTFKIPHALAALDSGVVTDPNVAVAFDGAKAPFDAWKRDHTLATAMRYSVVWYFQRLAAKLGPDRERVYLAKFDYGNQDISSSLTTFWLNKSLRLSPAEQRRFLIRLYEDSLPVSKAAMRTVQEILVQPHGVIVNATGEHPFSAPWPDGTVVSAKTGRGDDVAWLVGHVQRQSRAWVFVSCVTGAGLDPLVAIDLAARSLRSAAVL